MTSRFYSKTILVTLLFAFLAITGTRDTVHAKPPFTLENIQKGLLTRYRGVQHMGVAALQKALTGPDKNNYLVLDVREKDEYAVSHIPGARRVDPGIWHGPFMNRFGKLAKGKTVIFYCSVGERSSKLAKYVQDALKKNGTSKIYNLRGGIFAWHNEKRPLVSGKGPTDLVHPYDSYWGQLLKRADKLRYSPD